MTPDERSKKRQEYYRHLAYAFPPNEAYKVAEILVKHRKLFLPVTKSTCSNDNRKLRRFFRRKIMTELGKNLDTILEELEKCQQTIREVDKTHTELNADLNEIQVKLDSIRDRLDSRQQS